MQKELQEFFSRRSVRWALCAFAAVLILLLTLDAGIALGERHAYQRLSRSRTMGSMMPPPPGLMDGGFGFLPHGFMQEEHGAVGTITGLSLPTITVETRSGESEVVRVATSTMINGGPATSTDSLAVGQKVIVIGEPDEDEGGVGARLIRILPY